MIAIDDKIIAWTQTVYLWLWDRTGIYVATLLFIGIVFSTFLYDRKMGIFDFILVTASAIWCGMRYAVQGKDLRLLNTLQRSWAEWTVRRYLLCLINIPILFLSLLELNPWHVSSNLLSLAWLYLACVQVRDREPPEKLSFAKQNTGG